MTKTSRGLEDLLPSPDAGPDAVYARNLLIDALEDAIAELPANQREVFLAHEVEGRSFKAAFRRIRDTCQHAAVPQTLRRAAPSRAVTGDKDKL